VFEPAVPLSDHELVARAVCGDRESFAEIVRRYQAPLRRVARSRLGRSDWAEEVVQEAFLAAYKSCGTFNPRYSFRTWLWTILLNQCHGHYQRRRRSVPVEPLSEESHQQVAAIDAAPAPLARLLDRERADQLESLLNQLPLAQADALRLRFFGELKFQEIADAMQCSLNTAKNRVRVGLLRMAELLEGTAAAAHRGDSAEESCDL